MPRRRIALLADPSRREVAEVLDGVRSSLEPFVEIAAELNSTTEPLPADLEVDLVVAIGGDGTLISQARRIAQRDLPLVGVNVGRLGFLAAFDAASLVDHASVIFGPDPPRHHHMLLSVTARDANGSVIREDVAANDCVVSAGAPFRMIELDISIDGNAGPDLTGDGVIVATPVGSTAYNISAGGPIVHPTLDAIVITPLAAHSLAFRPIVLRDESRLRILVECANEGTSLVRDGEVVARLGAGDSVEVRRHHKKACFVANPATTYWGTVQEKLKWAAPPSYRER